MEISLATQEKLLAFLGKRMKELEDECNAIRSEFYDAVDKDNEPIAKVRLSLLVQRRSEFAEIAQEYYGGVEYLEVLKLITENERAAGELAAAANKLLN